MSSQTPIAYLRNRQAADGSFDGVTSPSITPFNARRKQATLFPTILILDCLREVIGSEDIRLRAAKYLESQVNSDGSWNYWDKRSIARQKEPYPNDLDDTACALAALTRSGTSWVDGFRLGQFARLLVATELQPGGPYNTWLVNTQKAPHWHNVDLAVNANIGYTLSLHDTQVSGLTDYVEAAIERGAYSSSYYVGELPVLYFLSRWYTGSKQSVLRQKVAACITGNVAMNSLQQALLLASGCWLGVSKTQLAPLAAELQATAKGGAWPAAALYVDPVYNQQQYYGGSKVVTTAFALEALTTYANLTVDAPIVITRKRGVSPIMASVRKDVAVLDNERLKRRYLAAARRIMQDTAGEQITAPATLMDQAGNWKTSGAIVSQLNIASLNGWMAYTLYDDFLDGQGRPEQLNVANIALRRSYAHCLAALPHRADWANYVEHAFDVIDSANDWEQQHARITVKRSVITVQRLPDYHQYAQLADRSWGHSLAACGVAFTHYRSLNHPQVQALQTFFRHFLIARQLNDDAHDWEDDLRAGHVSAVLAMLLRDMYQLPHTIHIEEELDSLRQYFWQYTIGDVAQVIRAHISSAQQALDELSHDITVVVFMGWLDTLESAVAAALKGRDEALRFMQAYEGSHA